MYSHPFLSKNIKNCRFVDDFRLFCKTEKEAYINLAFLANTLFENHGLILQHHKTRILTVEEFKNDFLVTEYKKTLNNL